MSCRPVEVVYLLMVVLEMFSLAGLCAVAKLGHDSVSGAFALQAVPAPEIPDRQVSSRLCERIEMERMLRIARVAQPADCGTMLNLSSRVQTLCGSSHFHAMPAGTGVAEANATFRMHSFGD